MTEVIGDIVEPTDLKLPKRENNRSVGVGDIFLSGSKIWFHNGTAMVIVTSG